MSNIEENSPYCAHAEDSICIAIVYHSGYGHTARKTVGWRKGCWRLAAPVLCSFPSKKRRSAGMISMPRTRSFSARRPIWCGLGVVQSIPGSDLKSAAGWRLSLERQNGRWFDQFRRASQYRLNARRETVYLGKYLALASYAWMHSGRSRTGGRYREAAGEAPDQGSHELPQFRRNVAGQRAEWAAI